MGIELDLTYLKPQPERENRHIKLASEEEKSAEAATSTVKTTETTRM